MRARAPPRSCVRARPQLVRAAPDLPPHRRGCHPCVGQWLAGACAARHFSAPRHGPPGPCGPWRRLRALLVLAQPRRQCCCRFAVQPAHCAGATWRLVSLGPQPGLRDRRLCYRRPWPPRPRRALPCSCPAPSPPACWETGPKSAAKDEHACENGKTCANATIPYHPRSRNPHSPIRTETVRDSATREVHSGPAPHRCTSVQ